MNSRQQVIIDMKNTEQTKGMSVYKHGELVKEYFLDLYNYLTTNKLKHEFRIPDWLEDNKDFVLSEINKYSLKDLSEYHLMHDCGKPYCLEIDEEGRRHFKNHAYVSYLTYKNIGSDFIANLIKEDMDIHLLKNDGVEEFCKREHCIVLLLTGLAEISANASMFGGIESTSFKIKYKNILKRGKAIIKNLKKQL